METATPYSTRQPLTRDRVLDAAVELADGAGIDALSMRKLASELGVDPMALYRHVRNKEDLLDGVLQVVIGQVEPAPDGLPWKAAVRAETMNARAVMVRHPWARRVLEERGTGGPAQIALIERHLAILFGAGFSVELAHHALHVLDSRIFGFSPALFDETCRAHPTPDQQAAIIGALASYPSVARLAGAVSHDGPLGACDDDVEFAFGL